MVTERKSLGKAGLVYLCAAPRYGKLRSRTGPCRCL